jgi:rubrerythrin
MTCSQVAELIARWDEQAVERRCAAGVIPARRGADGSWRVAAETVRELLPPSQRALWPKVDAEPSGRLPDGTPYYGKLGEIARDADEDKVQCHLCGAWLRAVGGSHLSRVHGWTVREYRAAFHLLKKVATVTEGSSDLYRANAKRRLAAGELPSAEGTRTARNTPGAQPVPRWRSLAQLRPDLAAELHPTRNAELDPHTLGAWSSRKVWWRCSRCGHEWRRDVCGRTAGAGCPECGRQRSNEASRRRYKKSLAELRPDLAAELHPTRNGELDPHTLGAWSRRKVWWLCPVCGHEWRTDPGNRNGADTGCPICTRQRVYGPSLADARPDLAAELRDLDPSTIGPGSHRRVWWRCSQCAREWEQPPAGRRSHPRGGGCRSCRGRAALAAKGLDRDERGRLLPAGTSARQPRTPPA